MSCCSIFVLLADINVLHQLQRVQPPESLFASGAPYARVAEAEGIRPVTVRNTISRVQEKLGLPSKQELVIWAVKHGLVEDREQDE
ncbi:MAG: helix-turn-helix transcriptional regulator [Dehalococcoidia bacterium]|nr:helix-turn-helix transcriptional regulator [Dehalococcoidia bacterium]